jgi:hypothetical protein
MVAIARRSRELSRTDPSDSSPRDSGTPASGISLSSAIGMLYGLLGFLIGSRVIADNSLFTHFANGRLIWDGGGIPIVDPYSFTAAGESVTVQSWLPSWIYVGLHDTLGGWALRLLNGAICALLIASLWRLAAGTKQLLPRVLLVGAAIVVGAGLWTPRPLLFGLLCFAAVLHVLRSELPAWTLLGVMWIWVNSHGSFPIALVLIGATGLGQFVDDLRAGKKTLPVAELRVFAFAVSGTALGALNPLGFRLLTFPISLLSRSEALENVVEWRHTDFDSASEWGFACLIVMFVVTLKRGASARSIVPGVIFIAAGIYAYRNLPMASFVLVAVIAPFFSVPKLTIDGDVTGLVPRALRLVAVAGVALIALSITQQGAFDFRRYPVDEVAWLEERDLVANDEVRIVHRDIVGNYLELQYGADANVFVDDRFDFYPFDVLDAHDVFIFGGDYAAVIEQYNVNVVLWRGDSDFTTWILENEDWIVAYDGVNEGPPGVDVERSEAWIIACHTGSSVVARCS